MSVKQYQRRSAPVVSPYVPISWYSGWKRGRVSPSILREQLSAFFEDTATRGSVDQTRYAHALSEVRRLLQLPVVKPYHINDVIQRYKHIDRSPCLPWVKYGYKSKAELPAFFIKKFVHGLKYWRWKMRAPCLALGRSHIHQDKEKTRLIWGYPAHHTFAEGVFAMPFIDCFQRIRTPYTLWARLWTGHFSEIMGSKSPSKTWLGLDFSNFDARVPAWLIRDAFKILESYVDFNSYEQWGKPTDPNALRKMWKEIVRYFINTPIQIDRDIFVKSSGIPSGSYFTQIIGTLCNMIMVNYVIPMIGVQYFHGDDSLVEVSHGLDLPAIAGQFRKHFGAVVNPDKCEYGEEPVYLGFKNRLGKPGTDVIKLKNQAAFPATRDRCLADAVMRVRGLQLACFGVNEEFMCESQRFLSAHANVSGSMDREVQRTLDMLGIPAGVTPHTVAFLLS